MLRAFRKFNFPLEARQNLNNATNRGTENGEVVAAPEENEAEFLSPVFIGGQQLHLDFDTGSSDLSVTSVL